jgi:hypothetical protein
MRLAISLALLLVAAAAPRQGCGNGGTPAYDPCAGKACGEPCTVCPPGSTDCMETAVVKACDPSGRCVPMAGGMCAEGECAGKSCGAPCAWPDLPCLHATPPCLPPQGPGYCNLVGICAQGYPPPADACPPPEWGCVGKKCGDSCGVCPPGTDPANCPVPTFAATACDAQLQCVTVGTFTCPTDPCAGKKCGDACDPCGGLCMNPVAYHCDASSACVAGAPSCPP